eukprot:TRINITY_DN3023_c1_g2_i2.p1 TRINITY_DN3023_c1_g2~~TRINITY_DN3023_c1_g2_i2.p1  ORF type:complete len:316 (-),score=62.68 TRINITY_DN3023_c1_g2_i2:96-1043(-)
MNGSIQIIVDTTAILNANNISTDGDSLIVSQGSFVVDYFSNSGNFNVYSGTVQITNFFNYGNFNLKSIDDAAISYFTNFGVASISQSASITGNRFTNDGTLQGLGTVQSTLLNNGTILLGARNPVVFSGSLTVSNLILTATSLINTPIKEVNPQSDYPQLIITQDAHLDGNYTFSFLQGYTPNAASFTPILFQRTQSGYFAYIEQSKEGTTHHLFSFLYTSTSFSFTTLSSTTPSLETSSTTSDKTLITSEGAQSSSSGNSASTSGLPTSHEDPQPSLPAYILGPIIAVGLLVGLIILGYAFKIAWKSNDGCVIN